MPTPKLSGVVCICNSSVSSWGQMGPWGTICELSERPCLKKVEAMKEDWQQSPCVRAHTWLDFNELINEAFRVRLQHSRSSLHPCQPALTDLPPNGCSNAVPAAYTIYCFRICVQGIQGQGYKATTQFVWIRGHSWTATLRRAPFFSYGFKLEQDSVVGSFSQYITRCLSCELQFVKQIIVGLLW